MAHYPAVVAGGAACPDAARSAAARRFRAWSGGIWRSAGPCAAGAADPRDAARYLVESCAEAPGEIIICAVGPLTNLAAALALDASITRTAARVVVMGGSAARHGNVSDCAEANIWNDPHAADAVFAADWDVTMVGLDVTEKTQCVPADFTTIAEGSPIIGGFLKDATGFYFDFHEAKTGNRVCFMHDPSALMAITNPELFGFEAAPISVVCEGADIGRTVTGAADAGPCRLR